MVRRHVEILRTGLESVKCFIEVPWFREFFVQGEQREPSNDRTKPVWHWWSDTTDCVFQLPQVRDPEEYLCVYKKIRRLKRSCLLSALRYLLVIFEGQVQTNVLMNLLSPRK